MNRQVIDDSIIVEFDRVNNQWLIYHSGKISTSMVKLEKWFQKNLPITENIICFIDNNGKTYKTNLLECFNVIAFMRNPK